MKKYRITKYNPAFRNEKGHYTRNEWTSIHDIGKTYGGEKFDLVQYFAYEKRYIETVLSIIQLLDIADLKIKKLELNAYDFEDKHFQYLIQGIENEKNISIKLSIYILELMLREILWCELVNNRIKIYCGWDYYIYIEILDKDLGFDILNCTVDGIYIESIE